MAEYALILALIAVVTAAVIFTLGGQISSVFSSVTGQF
jgi:Flp pilus assembly pilin Flp